MWYDHNEIIKSRQLSSEFFFWKQKSTNDTRTTVQRTTITRNSKLSATLPSALLARSLTRSLGRPAVDAHSPHHTPLAPSTNDSRCTWSHRPNGRFSRAPHNIPPLFSSCFEPHPAPHLPTSFIYIKCTCNTGVWNERMSVIHNAWWCPSPIDLLMKVSGRRYGTNTYVQHRLRSLFFAGKGFTSGGWGVYMLYYIPTQYI